MFTFNVPLRRVQAAGLVSVLPGTLLAQSTAAAKPVRIGFICPFTGGSQDFGRSAKLGAELAVKEINEVGGFLGRPIELVARDDKANPDEGRRVSEELVLKEKVDFTIGFCNTGVALKSLDVFQNNKHLLVVPVSTGSAVTATYPPAQSYIFRMSARDTLQAAVIGDDPPALRGHPRPRTLARGPGPRVAGRPRDPLAPPAPLAGRGVTPDLGEKPLLVREKETERHLAVGGYPRVWLSPAPGDQLRAGGR